MNALPAALTFDAAGTLFLLEEPVGVTYSRFARSHGIVATPEAIEQAFASAFGELSPPHSIAGESGEHSERTWWRTLVLTVFEQVCGRNAFSEETFEALFATLFDHFANASAWRLAPGVVDVLESLGQHTRLGVISNFDGRFHSIAGGLGLSRHFEMVILSSEVRASKPDPAIFAAAAEKLSLSPSEILHIGDDPIRDVKGAQEAGFRTFPAITDDNPVANIPDSLGISMD